MEMRQALELLSSFTADQWGMVTSRQARTVGVDASTLHRLEKAGYVDRVRHGVYASNTAAVTFARDEQAAWLALNPAVPRWERPVPDPDGGVLSHVSATQLHGLGELPFERITFTTPRRRASRDEDLWFKRADLTSDEIAFVDDSAANVRGARAAGLRSALHRASTGAAGLASDLIAIGVPA